MGHSSGVGCHPVRQIGKGGMAVVYEAVVGETGDRYALKVFTVTGERAAFLRRRFLAEGAILSRLDHPNIVKVRGYGIEEDGEQAYIVMDLVYGLDGEPHTLSSLHAAHEIDEERLVGWYGDLVCALKYIHSQGVVHRDIKPSNVLIDADGRAVLADFGVSRIEDDSLRRALSVEPTMATNATELTRIVLGTANYFAPEVRRGEPATAASDIYSLGVTFFRLLTGMWYEPGTNAFDLLAPFDPAWRGVFASLLADNPADRALVPLNGAKGNEPPPSTVRAFRFVRDTARRWPVATAAAAAALLVAAFAVSLAAHSKASYRTELARSEAETREKGFFDPVLGPYDYDSAKAVAALKTIRVDTLDFKAGDMADAVCMRLVRRFNGHRGLKIKFYGGQVEFGKAVSMRDSPLFDVLNEVTDAVNGSGGTWWVEKGVVHLCVFATMEERVYEIVLDGNAREFFTSGTVRLGENYDIYYAPDLSKSRFEYVERDGVGLLSVRGRRGNIEKVLKRLEDARVSFRYRRRKVLLVMPE